MKPYKEQLPLRTINVIRNILEQLGIVTIEYHVGMNDYYYSCRVIIGNDKMRILNIGTNGKGLSVEYALASAYGELMERIQNRMILKDMFYATSKSLLQNQHKFPYFVKLIKETDNSLDFRYYPDEREYRLISWDMLEKQLKNFLPHVYKDAAIKEIESVRGSFFNITLVEAPFYNVGLRVVEYLPLQLIRLSSGSTGLCAGNTPEEAILQGIHEIFERYVLQQIYLLRISPPTIPVSCFVDNEVIDKLESLKKTQNILYEIKDCSLGKGFPVIGLLLIDMKNNTYSFRLGADANPNIALQRCYTEAFQGIDMNKYVFNSIEFEDSTVDYRNEYNKNVLNGSGRFPSCIFANEPTYAFKGLVRMNCETNKDELYSIVNFLTRNNYRLYIRDNSFLNFPAYHLYIPGLSEVSSRLYSLTNIVDRLGKSDFTYDIPLEYRIKSLDNEKLRMLYDQLEVRQDQIISLFPYYTGLHNKIDRYLLQALIAFKLSDLNSAFKKMSLFIKKNRGVDRYYYAFRDYLYWKKYYLNDDISLEKVLGRLYGNHLAQEIIKDTKNDVFKYFMFPDCFNCDRCEAKSQCSFFSVLKLDVLIQNRFKYNIPDQKGLRKIFDYD